MRPTVHRRLPAAFTVAALASVLAITLGACSGQASIAPSATPGSSPTGNASQLVLDRAPDNLGCDAMAVDYTGTTVTFHIDITATPQVWAETESGKSLRVRWDSTFSPGTGAEPTVVDDAGAEVLKDGDELAIPDGSWPSLHGHFVCPSTDALFVLDETPS